MRRQTADPVKARTRAMYATLKRRAGNQLVMSLEALRMEFDYFMRKGAQCRYCRVRVTHKTVSLDHMIPVNRGGWHTMSNLAFVCRGCNKAKGNMTDAEFADLLKVLTLWSARHRRPELMDELLASLKVAGSFRIGANRRAKKR